MRVIAVLALLCLLHLAAGRRVKREGNQGPDIKNDNKDLLEDEFAEEDDDLFDEPDPFNPKDVEAKCAGKSTNELKADCVCRSAEGADLSRDEIKSRCKQLRMSVFKIRALPFSCKHHPLIEPKGKAGCRAWHPSRGQVKVEPEGPGPEMKKDDEVKQNDDLDDLGDLEDDLEDDLPDETPEQQEEDKKEVEEEDKEDKAYFCENACALSPGKGKCGYMPALGDDTDYGDDVEKRCAENCKLDGTECHSNDDPTPVEEKTEDDDTPVADNDQFEEPEEDLGESDVKDPEPVMTCAALVKAATPGKMATKAQVSKWCGGKGCGTKLKMRRWAICGLADGAVKGPGYHGAITDEKGPFDCYINCKGEAEQIGGVVEDCISQLGGWGRCSANCGGGVQRKQLHIKKYPSGGGKVCPTPQSRQCHTHKCPDCFPADASVETSAGLKSMSDLRVGDLVRSVDGSGNIIYDEVYFFGHADNSKSTEYVNLKLSDTDTSLQLSRGHFIPMCPKHGERCNWADHIHAYGQDVRPGDHIWVTTALESKLRTVLETSIIVKEGLYNPYTLSGKIVVNGVVASAHSNWVLDDWTPSSMSKHLPAIYQLLFLPGRVLYQFAGASAADYLDVNNPQLTGTHGYGPEFLLVCLLSGLAISLMAMRKVHMK